MKVVRGDLIKLAKQGSFDVIIHGCNCCCTMGAGIALAIKSAFPTTYEVDCRTMKGDRSKLGRITFTSIAEGLVNFIVVNAYTQHGFGSESGPSVDYEAVRSCMRTVREMFSGKRIGLPKIGAGLAGGDWPTIREIIDEELADQGVTLVEFSEL